LESLQALTVTSKRLADLTKARGFFKAGDKGINPSKGKSKGKGKGKSKDGSKSKNSGKGHGKNKGSGVGKPSPMPTQANFDLQQKRIRDALCLGCGSAGHWLRDCPSVQRHSAQMVTAGMTLDPAGNVEEFSQWMTSTTELAIDVGKDTIQLPYLSHTHVETTHDHDHDHDHDHVPVYSQGILMNPKVLIQYAHTDAALMIADTGCQRQVAGSRWHSERQREISPLEVIPYTEHCHFSFGPNAGVPSKQRLAYPSGIAGRMVVLGISEVDENAPALFSRPSFEILGAVPDIVQGVMHYKALGPDAKSKLFLSKCGHLAIRIDEWSHESFEWPVLHDSNILPDAWIPGQLPLKKQTLQNSKEPARPPPHAGASIFSTRMAEELEASHRADLGVHLHSLPGSFDVCGSEYETCPQGQGPEDLVAKTDGHHDAGNLIGIAASISDTGGQVPREALDVPARKWHTSLRSSRSLDFDLRPMRGKVDQRPTRRSSASASESHTNSQDSPGDQGQEKGRHSRIFSWLATGLTAALAIATRAGLPEVSNSTAPTNANQDSFQDWLSGLSSAKDEQHEWAPTAGTPCDGLGGGKLGRLDEPQSSLRSHDRSRGETRLRGLRVGTATRAHSRGAGNDFGAGEQEIGGTTSRTTSKASATSHSLSPMPSLCGSADDPLLQEDRGAFQLRQGTQKRLLGKCEGLERQPENGASSLCYASQAIYELQAGV